MTETEIVNLALGHLGAAELTQNYDTDQSAAGKTARVFFETTRKKVFEDFDWPFARRYADLNLVELSPNARWAASFRYPTDCAAVREIETGLRAPKENYEIGSDNAGKLVLTNSNPCTIRYTKYILDISLYTQSFVEALSYLLASKMAPRLTKGDPFKIRNETYQLYMATLATAKANNANEEQQPGDPTSEFERMRG